MEHWAEQRISGKIKALVDRMEWKWWMKRRRSQGDLPDLWLTQDGDVGQAAEIGKKRGERSCECAESEVIPR